jgi:hypothetical protein
MAGPEHDRIGLSRDGSGEKRPDGSSRGIGL